jgi:cytochrome P450
MNERHPLAAMQVFHRELGDVFRIQLPGFTPVVLAGPEAARFVLVQGRHDFRWRNESDPVTHLLRHGVLVEDGDSHDNLRRLMAPSLHRRMLDGYTKIILDSADEVTHNWKLGSHPDMLVEMRKIALLVLTRSLFRSDISPEMAKLWHAILGVIAYISPGVWMIWRNAPRPSYRQAIHRMDQYLYRMINLRRQELKSIENQGDLLSTLILSGLDDALIRDQLLTMLIAGHDTSTALLSWSLYLLGAHPDAYQRVRKEIDTLTGGNPAAAIDCIGEMHYLQAVLEESLRLYPPIHLGSRLAAIDLEYDGYLIPAGERVIYSIYLTQRHPAHWSQPDEFIPDRHLNSHPAPYNWLAFGGGPRNCIGAAFGQLETRLILARIFQQFDLQLTEKRVHPHMGATLEPRPSVRMRILRRKT